MITKIANLSNQLRDEGLPVSIRSTFSASEVYLQLGETDRDLLRTALRAIYVKDKYDIPKFNKIFEEIFKKEKVPSEDEEMLEKGKAYRGTGPKSNKYIIKKQNNAYKKVQKEKINNENAASSHKHTHSFMPLQHQQCKATFPARTSKTAVHTAGRGKNQETHRKRCFRKRVGTFLHA